MNLTSRMPYLISLLAAVTVSVLAIWLKWCGLTLHVAASSVASLLSPLLLAAGFIERAVEVVISPWRDPRAGVLQTALNAAQSATPPVPADIAAAQANLNAYKAQTSQYAFTASFLMGLAAAIVGIRALWPFLGLASSADFDKLSLQPGQRTTFLVIDILLSAALLSGGADGIHSVVSAFTNFFSASAQKSAQSVQPPLNPKE